MNQLVRNIILDQATDIINHDLQQNHGNPDENFATIAQLWSAYLGCEVGVKDAAVMMVLFEAARFKANPKHLDKVVGMVGYAAIAGELASVA